MQGKHKGGQNKYYLNGINHSVSNRWLHLFLDNLSHFNSSLKSLHILLLIIKSPLI